MRVFVVGASGFIGRSLVERLLAEGHEVGALARNEASAAALSQLGVKAYLIEGGFEDADAVVAAITGWDALVDVAQHNFRRMSETAKALNRYLKPGTIFISTTGTNFYGDSPTSRQLDESCFFGWRPRSPSRWPKDGLRQMATIADMWPGFERVVLEGAARGVLSCIVRSSFVYGRGSGGINGGVLGTMQQAAKLGSVLCIDDGRVGARPTVHVDDLAELYTLLLAKLAAGDLATGSIVNGSSGSASLATLAEAVASACGGLPVNRISMFEAEESLGLPAAESATQICQVSSAKARGLGWAPRRMSLVEELTSGSYAWPKLALELRRTPQSKI